MSSRVLLGKIDSTNYGLTVSKPGVDVIGANADQLIFDSRALGYGQAIFKESITLTRGTTSTRTFATQSIPNPAIIILGEQYVEVSNITGTQASFLVPNYYPSFASSYPLSAIYSIGTGGQPPASTTITYVVLRGHI